MYPAANSPTATQTANADFAGVIMFPSWGGIPSAATRQKSCPVLNRRGIAPSPELSISNRYGTMVGNGAAFTHADPPLAFVAWTL